MSPRRNATVAHTETPETPVPSMTDNMVAVMKSFTGTCSYISFTEIDEMVSALVPIPKLRLLFPCFEFKPALVLREPNFKIPLTERETEIDFLQNRVETGRARSEQLNKQIIELKERKKQLTKMTSMMKEEEKRFQRDMSKFWSIISMFVTVKSE